MSCTASHPRETVGIVCEGYMQFDVLTRLSVSREMVVEGRGFECGSRQDLEI